MLGLTFSSKLHWVSYIISVAKTATKKIGALNRSEVSFSWVCFVSLRIYNTWLYCILHGTVAISGLVLLFALQETKMLGVEPLAHHRNVVGLSLFYRYYFGKCSSELAQLVLLPYSRWRSTRYFARLHFLSTFLDVKKMSMSTVSFLAQLDTGILCL